MKVIVAYLSIILTLQSFPVLAGEFPDIKLEGYVIVGPEELVDPSPDAPINRAYIVINGLAAKQIYDHMSYTTNDVLLESLGPNTKTAGNLLCFISKHYSTYQCGIGINLVTGEADVGLPM